MPTCPDCGTFYDPTNETQPCCGACGYWPSGYGYDGPTTSADLPPYATDMTGSDHDTAGPDERDLSDDAPDADTAFSPDDDLPF